MKLEASPVGENGTGMAQVQSQLATLTIQLQELAKGKEKHKEVWCVTCRTKVIIRMSVQLLNSIWLQEL
jgi:hypothetical protein